MTDLVIPVAPKWHEEIGADQSKVDAIVTAASSFSGFLRYWHFKDQERGVVKCLGDELWGGQVEFVKTAEKDKWIFFLKARKLGFTTLEVAYDSWVLRFRDRNARVHLFSRREKAAQNLLAQVRFGLSRLPAWMQLDIAVSNQNELILDAGPDDERIAVAYPADDDTAVEDTCTHGHVDEWARMGNPERVWQAIEPTMAGTCHIVTTGLGPANYSSLFWQSSMAGDTSFTPFFVGALSRPDRSEAWLRAKRRGMSEKAFRQEYAMSWEDALFGGGEFVFDGEDLSAAAEDTSGASAAVSGRKYITAWDVGRHQDAAVGIVLDVTEDVHDVVYYERLRGVSYPWLQQRIESVHKAYPGPTAIEANAAGEAVMENLAVPPKELVKFNTTKTSKARIIEGLVVAFQNQLLRYDPHEWPQLDTELRSYQLPDDSIIQDSVMTLAIAYDQGEKAWRRGKAKVYAWG